MKFYYYSIYCKITGKQYIGITTNIEERWKRHISLLNSNKHHSYKLQEAWNTFGKDNFDFNIIDELETDVETAYEHEKELIKKYNSCYDGYNVLIGGKVNPIYTEEVYEKMIKTKQSQVDNIIQLKELELNHFQIIRIWNSKKEATRIGGYDFRNICKSVKDHVLGNGYYWVEESKIKEWKPKRHTMNPVAELDENGNVLQVRISPREIEKENNWAVSSICNAIKRNGLTHSRKFKFITEEEFYKFYPITIEPVQTIPEA